MPDHGKNVVAYGNSSGGEGLVKGKRTRPEQLRRSRDKQRKIEQRTLNLDLSPLPSHGITGPFSSTIDPEAPANSCGLRNVCGDRTSNASQAERISAGLLASGIFILSISE